jgi:hypothetical protein
LKTVFGLGAEATGGNEGRQKPESETRGVSIDATTAKNLVEIRPENGTLEPETDGRANFPDRQLGMAKPAQRDMPVWLPWLGAWLSSTQRRIDMTVPKII